MRYCSIETEWGELLEGGHNRLAIPEQDLILEIS